MPTVHRSSTSAYNHLLWALFPRPILARASLGDRGGNAALTSNYPESCAVIRSIMIPVTAIVPRYVECTPVSMSLTGATLTLRPSKLEENRSSIVLWKLARWNFGDEDFGVLEEFWG